MAAKKKKATKKTSKPELSATGETAGSVVKRFLKAYEDTCLGANSCVSPQLKAAAKKCIEDERFITKVILEKHPTGDAAPLLTCLAAAMRDSRYIYFKELYVWGVVMDDEQLVALAQLFEKSCFPLRSVELLDCLVEPRGLRRLCSSVDPAGGLASLTLDYNEFGDEGCRGLVDGLRGNTTLVKLSLCYCALTEVSGSLLGSLISTSAIRELFLDGNDLGCQGTQALIAACAAQAEREMSQLFQKRAVLAYEKQSSAGSSRNIDSSTQSVGSGEGARPRPSPPGSGQTKEKGKKRGRKRRGKSASSSVPSVGPWLSKLHIADNGIDAYDEGAGHVAPLICMRLMRRLLANSATLQELDLDDNLIGDLGGRELLAALKERSEVNGLQGVRLRTTHRMQAETFRELCKLGNGSVKKKKKRRAKKKT